MDNTVLEGKASVFGLLPSIDELLSTKAVIAMIAELGRTRIYFYLASLGFNPRDMRKTLNRRLIDSKN